MTIQNDIYFNAAYCGFLEGMLGSRSSIVSTTQADYNAIKASAIAMATLVDSQIPFDALVTTGAGVTQLAITTNTIAANEQWKAGLLKSLCAANIASGGYTTDAALAASATYLQRAGAIVAAWNDLVPGLVIP